MKKTAPLMILIVLFSSTLSACLDDPPPAPSPVLPSPTAAAVIAGDIVIGEVLGGIAGNNNYEYIELYNPTAEIQDLYGWSLWYRLPTTSSDLRLFRWTEPALIPPHGRYLLGRTGQAYPLTPDAMYTQALNLTMGGLALKRADQSIADRLGWGRSPVGFYEGSPAPALANGMALERLPGGDQGSGIDAGDNSQDFRLQPDPYPQNSSSLPAPAGEPGLALRLEAPRVIEPGQVFNYRLLLSNQGDVRLEEIEVRFPIDRELVVQQVPAQCSWQDEILVWSPPDMLPGQTHNLDISVKAPWSYVVARAANVHAVAPGWSGAAFLPPVYTAVSGGVVPVRSARELLDAELMIEGTVTMYTGALFAGSGNTKFYLQDESGGLQVQVFGGAGQVQASIGSRVQVRGKVGVYRGARQIVPLLVPEDITLLAPADSTRMVNPEPVKLSEARTDRDHLLGLLVQVEGELTRLEEFAYSYELDLQDEQGGALSIYVDKMTEITVERLVEGRRYQITGILETRDDENMLYPRRQADIEAVYPARLWVEATAPPTVKPGEIFTSTLVVSNYSTQTLTGVVVELSLPQGPADFGTAQNGGRLEEGKITWLIAQLSPEGGTVHLEYALRAGEKPPGESYPEILISDYRAWANEWSEPVSGPAANTFLGGIVPVWAIQGPELRSPFVLETVTTRGIVSGIFPDLGGFWIQEGEPDQDERTSEGVFVLADVTPAGLQLGQQLILTGTVRERYQQTTLELAEGSTPPVVEAEMDLPAPVWLDPPPDAVTARDYFETLEGMLVAVSGNALAVAPTSRYGEYVVVREDAGAERLFRGGDNAGLGIMVDDGSEVAHRGRETLPYLVSTGDRVRGLAGPLAYSFGSYKIEPVSLPEVTHRVDPLPYSTFLEPELETELRLMTWNVENLFDLREPHPADPPRPRPAEYELALTRVAGTIAAAGFPAVVALQEVENIDILVRIAGQPLLEGFRYQPVLLEGDDSRGIDVGYLIREDKAVAVDIAQFPAPEGLTSRHPLMVDLQLVDGSRLLILNNHFTSMSEGESATEPRRTAQAAWNVQILADFQAEAPDLKAAVVGDLNSYLDSLPVDTLRQGGLQHVYTAWDDPRHPPYTYIYQGLSQTLDHILVTESLYADLDWVTVLHLNADYPFPDPQDPSPFRKSDHDPLVASFRLSH